MRTKKIIFSHLILLAGLITMTNIGCKKYPDGPMISFHSKTERVANTWKVDNYKVNGNDYTSLVTDYRETYSKDGNYSYSWGMINGTGKWAFQNKASEIKLTGTSNQADHTLIILKLEEKQFWYYYIDGSDKKEFHLIPAN
ncbi:MAG TPA: hypothetical protein VFL70_05845 [Bacteroidia bacterium]|nr:hypothetical protein [Bacteroidia bacterium]